MGHDKLKRTPRRFSRVKISIIGLILVIGAVYLLKHDQIAFRLQNLVNPIYGEIIFHADRDGDGIPQLYHLTFNTALRYSHVDQLTNLPEGAKNGVYSPDGMQIVFQNGNSIAVMQADGSNIHTLKLTSEDNPQRYPSIKPFWISPTQIVFQRVIGSSIDDSLYTCYKYAPFLFDLETQHESPLFEITSDANVSRDADGWWHFPPLGRYQNGLCGYENEVGAEFFPHDPVSFHPIFKTLETEGLLGLAMTLLDKESVVSPSGQRIARPIVSLYSTYPSGIELYTGNSKWQLIKLVHSTTVSWSPDSQYLVYDGLHPDGTWVIAFTSLAGNFTYPLIGNDGISYFAPSWRP